MRGTLGSGQASRGSLEPASALLGPLATTAPCLGRSPKANPSRSSGVRNESPTSCDCGGGPVSSWLALRGPAAAGRRSRQRAGPSGCSGRSGRQGHQSPTADRGCLAGDETKSPPRCGPRSSALLPLLQFRVASNALPILLPLLLWCYATLGCPYVTMPSFSFCV